MVTPTIDRLPSPPEEDDAKSPDVATPSGDKKTAKKRKSWGQVLPEPKTNLPPRKRAKTDDEKEQRRVERVLRNRRAAQSSRERKRLEVEALEQRNQELEKALLDAQKTNLLMFKQLQEMRQKSGLMTASNPLLDTLRNDTLALSQELFSSQDGYKAPTEATVNPSSLSPDSAEQALKQEPESEQATNSEALSAPSPDVTQCPAATLCDLPCHMSAEVKPSALPLFSQPSTQALLAWLLQFNLIFTSASATILSACQRPLMQIAMSSKARFSLRPAPQLLTTIIWLVTLPPSSTSTTTSISTTTMGASPRQNLWQRATTAVAAASQRTTGSSTTRSPTLRLRSLRKILSSSPNLARPLSDATMVAMRLVSEGRDDRVGTSRRGLSSATRDTIITDDERELTKCLSGMPLPSMEVLMTLLWSIKVEERRLRRGAVLRPETSVRQDKTYRSNRKYVLKLKKEHRGNRGQHRATGGLAHGRAI